MAHVLGKPCIPHISGSGLGYLYMMHFVSALPNAGPFHEFKGFNLDIPFNCDSSDLKIRDGKVMYLPAREVVLKLIPDSSRP